MCCGYRRGCRVRCPQRTLSGFAEDSEGYPQKLFRGFRFFLGPLLRLRRSDRAGSQCSFFALQISASLFALGSCAMLLTHACSIDETPEKRNPHSRSFWVATFAFLPHSSWVGGYDCPPSHRSRGDRRREVRTQRFRVGEKRARRPTRCSVSRIPTTRTDNSLTLRFSAPHWKTGLHLWIASC